MKNILVLCTGNTCRSQIAEGLFRNKYPEHEVFSAGTHPENMVNPYAMKAMMEHGINMSDQYPKLLDQFIDDEFDYVFTVCDSAKESFPIFPNAKNEIHLIIAEGDVIITEEDKKSTSEKVAYSPKEKKIILIRTPVIYMNENKIEARRITIYQESGDVFFDEPVMHTYVKDEQTK